MYHYPLIYSSFRPFVHKKLISLLQRRHKSKIMVNLSGCTKIMFDSQLIHVIHNIHEKYIHIHFPCFSQKWVMHQVIHIIHKVFPHFSVYSPRKNVRFSLFISYKSTVYAKKYRKNAWLFHIRKGRNAISFLWIKYVFLFFIPNNCLNNFLVLVVIFGFICYT